MLRPGIGLGLSDHVPGAQEPGERTSVINWPAAAAELARVTSLAFAEPLVYTDAAFPEGTATWGTWIEVAEAERGAASIADLATVELTARDLVDADGAPITPREGVASAPVTLTRYPSTPEATTYDVREVRGDGVFWTLTLRRAIRPTPRSK